MVRIIHNDGREEQSNKDFSYCTFIIIRAGH